MAEDVEKKAQEIISTMKSSEVKWRTEHGFWREARDAIHSAETCYIEPLVDQLRSMGRMESWVIEKLGLMPELTRRDDLDKLIKLTDLAAEEILKNLLRCGCQDKTQYV